MIAVEKPRHRATAAVALQSARYEDGYRLRLAFTDGKVNVVDFGPFLQSSRHPAIRVYLNKRRFKRFTVEDGFLHWNDFDLVFPMAELYAGRISGVPSGSDTGPHHKATGQLAPQGA